MKYEFIFEIFSSNILFKLRLFIPTDSLNFICNKIKMYTSLQIKVNVTFFTKFSLEMVIIKLLELVIQMSYIYRMNKGQSVWFGFSMANVFV